MPDYDTLCTNLEKRGFAVTRFATKEAACDYLCQAIHGKTVGAGGSQTLSELGLLERLTEENTVYSHALPGHDRETDIALAAGAQVYLSSLNGVAETGELINIDGRSNRVSATLHGHEAVYFVVGRNKIAPDFQQALFRARNIAGPKNAQRLKRKTPCAVRADRCYDCKSPERICAAMTIYWRRPSRTPEMEIVIVNQELGF